MFSLETKSIDIYCFMIMEELTNYPFADLIINVGPKELGIYFIYRNGVLVYIGKSSGLIRPKTVRERLNSAFIKIDGRQNISVAEMTCKWLSLDNNEKIDNVEHLLIEHNNPEWNGSGFGHRLGIDNSRNGKDPYPWDITYPPKNDVSPIVKLKFKKHRVLELA